MRMEDAVKGIGEHASVVMPRQSWLTLPMVRRLKDRVVVYRLIYPLRPVPHEPAILSPPKYVASYDLTTGRFISLEILELELPDLPPQPWRTDRYRFDNADSLRQEYANIWALYDLLIPAFTSIGSTLPDSTIRSAARSYLTYFDRHAEKPLLPYYQHFGGEFIDYVKRMAK